MNLEAIFVETAEGQRAELLAPHVGWFTPAVRVGALLNSGLVLGTLEVVGAKRLVCAPANAFGRITSFVGGKQLRSAVGYREPLFAIDCSGAAAAADSAASMQSTRHFDGTAFTASIGGRCYLRPAPGKPAFVQVGDVITTGTTVCLLEVMKTFHRVTFGGDGMPAKAKVVAIVPAEDSDVAAGDVLLRIEAVV